MARPKEFDREQALNAAVAVFREFGFEGTSTDRLVQRMGIGRQSLYDTFGDKWRLYRASLERYIDVETQAHMAALRSRPRAIDGIKAMVDRVVAEAGTACLGINSVCEFGRSRPEIVDIHEASERRLGAAIGRRIREAQAEGDIAADLQAEATVGFLIASFAGIRIAARRGADDDRLKMLGQLTLRALR